MAYRGHAQHAFAQPPPPPPREPPPLPRMDHARMMDEFRAFKEFMRAREAHKHAAGGVPSPPGVPPTQEDTAADY